MLLNSVSWSAMDYPLKNISNILLNILWSNLECVCAFRGEDIVWYWVGWVQRPARFSFLVLDLEPFQFHFHFSKKNEGILFFTFHFSKKN